MTGAFVASLWTPNWSTWSYYATVMPMTFGYSVFLCCQLGLSIQLIDVPGADKQWRLSLVSTLKRWYAACLKPLIGNRG
jgi:hypothetical protein